MTPNDVSPRWVGSGWTVFNNKGKPVRQYEPFFTNTHRFEFDARIGVSSVLFYDPAERVVATLHPNHTWEKVVFDPWRQETWDVNDTVLVADPKTDPDIGHFFQRLPDADYLPTWYAQRGGGALGSQEQAAAGKASIHADTPAVAHFDSLGRTFLTIAHNKFKRSDALPADPPTEEFYETRIIYDIEGNQREVIDAKGRIVMRYDYYMAGPEENEDGATPNRIHQASMEAGERWTLNDVTGNPIRAWDSRNHQFRTAYDQLRRPIETYMSEGAGPVLIGQIIYGETRLNPEDNNLRGQVIQLFDQAGVVTSDNYDFKGNLLSSQRQLAQEYKTTLDWSAAVPLEAPIFTNRTRYDALNRPIQLTAPHSDQPGTKINVIQPGYNEANLLEQVNTWLNQTAEPTELLDLATANMNAVTDIDYDAKGQRTLITYGNGAETTYEYDPLTFRLTKLTTTRPANPDATASLLFKDETLVQDLRYTYDPAGNITRIKDAALQTVFHGMQVDPVCNYTYDAIYRLIDASGREHIGQTAHDFSPPNGNRRDYPFVGHAANPNDMQAMRNYTEFYKYDQVGNFDSMRHSANGGSWTRRYEYDEDSLIETDKDSNRLTSTTVGNDLNLNHTENYRYTDDQDNDVHGCMTAINSMTMVWDFEDQLQQVDLGGGGTAYYVYDAAGERVRKVIERQNGARHKERLYLGGFEIYRKYNGAGNTVTLERETLHIMDDQQRVALVETRTDTPASEQLIRYQLNNHLGSASLELDDQAQIISYEEYCPYGSTSYQAGRSQAEVKRKRYRYTGMERDEESGLSYHSARYYLPWLGRWLSADPLFISDATTNASSAVSPVNSEKKTNRTVNPRSLDSIKDDEERINLYKYVRNRPTRYNDQNGREPSRDEVVGLAELRKDGLKMYYREEVEDTYDLYKIYGGHGKFSSPDKGRTDPKRYLYSKRWGWLDMRHFAGGAFWTQRIYLGPLDVLEYLEEEEIAQGKQIRRLPSSFAYEDLPSNLLGVYFGKVYLNSKEAQGKSFSENITDFLDKLGFVDNPLSLAPNANRLPNTQKDKPTGPKNRTYTPLYTLEPRDSELDKEIVGYQMKLIEWVRNMNDYISHTGKFKDGAWR